VRVEMSRGVRVVMVAGMVMGVMGRAVERGVRMVMGRAVERGVAHQR
jgi:hypothetical protein